jgi:hypothetical protein
MDFADDERVRELREKIQAERDPKKLMRLMDDFDQRLTELDREGPPRNPSLASRSPVSSPNSRGRRIEQIQTGQSSKGHRKLAALMTATRHRINAVLRKLA